MTRPEKIFLVEAIYGGFTQHLLTWKFGSLVTWMDAGHRQNELRSPPSPAVDVKDTSIPDEQSIVDILMSVTDYFDGYRMKAWDITASIGTYYPRIWRPEIYERQISQNVTLSIDICGLSSALISSAASANILFAEIREIFSVIEPSQAQLNTYGHRLRQVLILSCTEVESAWRSIWEGNQRTPNTYRLSTNQYARLAAPLKLGEWTVRLTRSLQQLTFSPFASWDINQPTESLAWYNAYNATKHDREDHLDKATLGSALDALAAVFVMLCAQFGRRDVEGLCNTPFVVTKEPTWLAPECYVMSPFHHTPWRTTPLF